MCQKFRDVPNFLKKEVGEACQILSTNLFILGCHRNMGSYLPYSAPKPDTFGVQCRCPLTNTFLNTATKITSVETWNIQEHFIEFMDTLQAVESPTGKTPPLTLKVLHSVRFQVS